MTLRRWIVLAPLALLSGCSFIDDWGVFTTTSSDMDSGTPDAGPECVDTCTTDVACPNAGEICAIGTDGCLACQACTGCDPASCGTACVVTDADALTCECVALQGEGGACAESADCEADLLCADAYSLCLRSCATAADCTGTYTSCVDGYCYVDAVETDCTNAVDDDSDGFTDCSDFDCSSDPACAGAIPEYDPCPTGGGCDTGLTCSNGICLRPCTSDAECTADFPECADLDGDGTFECLPTSGCDFVYNAGCPVAGDDCYLVYSDGTTTRAGCFHPRGSTIPTGGECGGDALWCEPGASCFTDGSGGPGMCLHWCYVDDPSPCVGVACMPFATPPAIYMGRELGICAG